MHPARSVGYVIAHTKLEPVQQFSIPHDSWQVRASFAFMDPGKVDSVRAKITVIGVDILGSRRNLWDLNNIALFFLH